MKPVNKGPAPRDAQGKEIEYPGVDGHRQAKAALLDRLGRYCSYCERCGDLHVEHVIPKKHYPAVRHLWSNYLLGCANCNGTKTDRDTLTDDWDCLFPDEVNTAWAFVYGPGAIIAVNRALSVEDQVRAQKTLEMVGLDKVPPPDPAAKDLRWKDRDSAWQQALDALDSLQTEDSKAVRKHIIQQAANNGFFSVWWAVLGTDADSARRSDMTNRLIHAFKAHAGCYGADGSVKQGLSHG